MPGVIGSNVLRDIKRALLEMHGPNFAKRHSPNEKLIHVLALYEEVSAVEQQATVCSQVRVAGSKPALIPARSIKTIHGTTRPSNQVYNAIVEEHQTHQLNNGLLVAPSLVSVDAAGKVPLRITNFSDSDVYLQPCTPVAKITTADIEPPIIEYETSETVLIEEVVDGEGSIEDKVSELISRMDIGTTLTKHQMRQLREVIREYINTFSKDEDDIGYCDYIRHRIVLRDRNPVRLPHRQIPPQHWEEVRDHLKKCVQQGTIRPSSSPYASAVVLVRKRDGKLRLFVDYGALNSKTHRDAYPLPRIEEALDALKGAKYVCSLDLTHGFHQVPLAEEDIEKTAFRVGTGGLYEYTRMPFGLCNAPATFMRLMDHMLGDQNFQTVLTYLDDILVFGATFEETLQ